MRQQLLVEGPDDLHVISALCEKFCIPENFTIKSCEGIDNLLAGLPVRLKGDGDTSTIGIVVDADTDIAARWAAIRNALLNSGLYADVPSSPPSDGLVIKPLADFGITIGVWVMPDNRICGMLENFVSSLIPDTDPLLPIVDTTLATLEDGGINQYSLIHKEKARIHTWLAWQESPGTPMGLAITKKYLSTDGTLCGDFIGWLTQLFG